MKKYLSLLLALVMVLSLMGCGDQGGAAQPENATEQSGTQEAAPPAESSAQASTDAATETVLTEQELAQWTKYVNNWKNNGFLLSSYDRPQQIDLNELFYTGCGLDQEELSPEEAEKYLELTGMDEIYTEITRLTGEQIASVLEQRLGLTMADMEKPLEWCYLEESDAYVMQHGDTNAQNFICVAGVQKGNQVTLDCLSEMTGQTCRVTLKQPEGEEVWMFVSNEYLADETATAFEDSIFISDEAYMDVVARLGDENALQLRTFAENFQQWVPAESEIAPGVMSFAIYDLDGDGQLELLRTQVQGTGLFAFNSFYQADVENGQVYELSQQTSREDLALEIGAAYQEQAEAYVDQQGKIFYMASDYGRAGLQFSSCTEGYYYLENKTVVSEPIRSYTLELDEKEDELYTYYLPGQGEPVTESEWEAARQTFLKGKTATDFSISWKDLSEEEITEKKVQGWFLLLAESLEGAI